MTKQSAKTIQWRDKEKDKINVLSMMLNTKKDTDIHEFARQLKEHLGEECWVLVENRAPAGPGNLKIFEENNFKLPRDIRGLYSDTNGISLTWGTNANPTTTCGHLGFIKLESIVELGDERYSLTDCQCCPRISFNKDEHIFVQDRRGKWNFITDSIYNYFRLALLYGAALGWQLKYSPLGLSEKTKELIAFNFMPNITDHDDIDEQYPFKPIDRNKVEQVFQAKLRERSKANSNDKNIKKSRK